MNVFDNLERIASADDTVGKRAVIAVQERCLENFGSFLKSARGSTQEYGAKLSLIDGDIRRTAEAVAREYDYDNAERLYLAGTAVLGGGHASDCGCGFCENKGKLPGAKDDSDDTGDSKDSDDSDDKGDDSGKPWDKKSSAKTACDCGDEQYCDECEGENEDKKLSKTAARESIWHTAADAEDGDTYAQDRVDVSSGPDASPKIDKSRVPDSGLKPIEVPSERNPSEMQNIAEEPDYEAALPGPSDTGEHQDADKSVSPPDTDGTKTWTGTEGLADPVTSAVAAKWAVVE